MLTIAIIDRHPIVRLGLQLELNTSFSNPTLYEAGDFSEFQSLKKERIPNIFILGFHLSTISTYTSKVEKCRLFYPSVPLIVYGDYLTPKTIRLLVNRGVRGFLLKRNDGADLIKCVGAVSIGSVFVNSNLIKELAVQNFTQEVLSWKQLIIASLLIQGVDNSGICHRLNLKASTVSTVKSIIFKKLNVTNIIALREIMLRCIDDSN